MLSPGQQLKQLREENNRTQKEVAEMLGITAGTVSRKEQGKVPISLDERRKLIDFFKIPVYKQNDFF